MRSELSVTPISSPDDYPSAITGALDKVNAVETLAGFDRIIIKPNMVNNSPPQVTTDVLCVMAVVEYLKERTDTEIVVAEGSGEGRTLDNLKLNGYEQITRKFGVELVDLDALQVKRYENPAAGEYKEIFLPEYLEGAGLVSVPPAKDHTITRVTLGLKNMVGCLSARHYSGYWSFKKSQIHAVDTDQAIADLMLYVKPHLTIIDAIVGQAGGHLSGRPPQPPIGKIIASTDGMAADREAARLLGHDPDSIRHLTLAKRFL
ncbi:MAG: DUF362 domain-containing protein [bacterium]|nr:DUF362 domain-containing protein [bacterium]MDT8365137.1 DUF362 domain-containing protein [bacterium]